MPFAPIPFIKKTILTYQNIPQNCYLKRNTDTYIISDTQYTIRCLFNESKMRILTEKYPEFCDYYEIVDEQHVNNESSNDQNVNIQNMNRNESFTKNVNENGNNSITKTIEKSKKQNTKSLNKKNSPVKKLNPKSTINILLNKFWVIYDDGFLFFVDEFHFDGGCCEVDMGVNVNLDDDIIRFGREIGMKYGISELGKKICEMNGFSHYLLSYNLNSCIQINNIQNDNCLENGDSKLNDNCNYQNDYNNKNDCNIHENCNNKNDCNIRDKCNCLEIANCNNKNDSQQENNILWENQTNKAKCSFDSQDLNNAIFTSEISPIKNNKFNLIKNYQSKNINFYLEDDLPFVSNDIIQFSNDLLKPDSLMSISNNLIQSNEITIPNLNAVPIHCQNEDVTRIPSRNLNEIIVLSQNLNETRIPSQNEDEIIISGQNVNKFTLTDQNSPNDNFNTFESKDYQTTQSDPLSQKNINTLEDKNYKNTENMKYLKHIQIDNINNKFEIENINHVQIGNVKYKFEKDNINHIQIDNVKYKFERDNLSDKLKIDNSNKQMAIKPLENKMYTKVEYKFYYWDDKHLMKETVSREIVGRNELVSLKCIRLEKKEDEIDICAGMGFKAGLKNENEFDVEFGNSNRSELNIQMENYNQIGFGINAVNNRKNNFDINLENRSESDFDIQLEQNNISDFDMQSEQNNISDFDIQLENDFDKQLENDFDKQLENDFDIQPENNAEGESDKNNIKDITQAGNIKPANVGKKRFFKNTFNKSKKRIVKKNTKKESDNKNKDTKKSAINKKKKTPAKK